MKLLVPRLFVDCDCSFIEGDWFDGSVLFVVRGGRKGEDIILFDEDIVLLSPFSVLVVVVGLGMIGKERERRERGERLGCH